MPWATGMGHGIVRRSSLGSSGTVKRPAMRLRGVGEGPERACCLVERHLQAPRPDPSEGHRRPPGRSACEQRSAGTAKLRAVGAQAQRAQGPPATQAMLSGARHWRQGPPATGSGPVAWELGQRLAKLAPDWAKLELRSSGRSIRHPEYRLCRDLRRESRASGRRPPSHSQDRRAALGVVAGLRAPQQGAAVDAGRQGRRGADTAADGQPAGALEDPRGGDAERGGGPRIRGGSAHIGPAVGRTVGR